MGFVWALLLGLASSLSVPSNSGAPGLVFENETSAASPILPEQVMSVFNPPVIGHNQVTAADVSDLFMTSRSDLRNTLMDHVKSAATKANSVGEAAQLMGFNSPIGLDSSASWGADGLSADARGDFMSHLSGMEAQVPHEIVSPSGQRLSLTNFQQVYAQTQGSSSASSQGVANVPQALQQISKEFGTTISSMAAHTGRMFGPSPSYNGPCQCRACMNVVHRLRSVLYDNTYHYGVQEIDQELDDRFCYGERWMYRSTCYHLVDRYREMLKILVWLGTKEFDVCSFLFQCYPTNQT
eukprot:c16582_g1_i1.p1 GENE.c16582_g1_i1~~c16582_g1_i1.p1  ORF type:complete len:296 (-),score=54.64 c16582_g1_i1:18-905(-)